MAQHNRKVPDKNTLQRWHDAGMTHQAMADRVLAETGERVSRAAISMALQRYNITTEQKARYRDEVPWHVRVEHLRAYPVRMLRLLGRRRSGEPMADDLSARLDGWLRQLEESNAVVAYDPDSDQGFFYVPREDGDPEDTPIRVRRVWTTTD